MFTRTVSFLAICLTAITLVPSGAHLFALPHKMAMNRDQYQTVQGIYQGWSLFGIPLILAICAHAVLAVTKAPAASSRWLSAGAALLLATSLVVFFTWTWPANQATANWTVLPGNWEDLRHKWEFAHAAGAVMTFAALACATLAALTLRR